MALTRLLRLLVLAAIPCSAVTAQDSLQDLSPAELRDGVDAQRELQRIRSANEPEPRELRVLTPTLAPEEIDRAVLNRLLHEIVQQPDRLAEELAVSARQLQDIFITLSNSRSFINDNQMAAIRNMCRAYGNSELSGEERIAEALAAYERRRQFTRDFVERYYLMVLADIEAGLNEPSKVRFASYMADRRRRMANAGTVTGGISSQNVTSGAESVEFHCRKP